MSEISKVVLKQLIELGQSGEKKIPTSLADPQHANKAIIRGLHAWETVSLILDANDLKNLIRGLVLFSAAGGFLGGSVSPVSILYLRYIKDNPDDEPALTKWIMENRVNPWDPFGTHYNGSAKSYEEYLENPRPWKKPYEVTQKNIHEEEIKQAKFEKERIEAATRNLLPAIKRGDLLAVEALLNKGADLSMIMESMGSLMELARSSGQEKICEFLKSKGIP